jgi:hypothetical protein
VRQAREAGQGDDLAVLLAQRGEGLRDRGGGLRADRRLARAQPLRDDARGSGIENAQLAPDVALRVVGTAVPLPDLVECRGEQPCAEALLAAELEGRAGREQLPADRLDDVEAGLPRAEAGAEARVDEGVHLRQVADQQRVESRAIAPRRPVEQP